MNYVEFGKILLDTYDLDPLYVVLAQTSWKESTMFKFLLGYWTFYSAGVACSLANTPSKNYYKYMRELDRVRAPRGHERRHMRGAIFQNTVKGYEDFGAPEKVVERMIMGDTFQCVSNSVQHFKGYGPWISWKIADMKERVLQIPVDFGDAEIGVYRDPVKGAALIHFGDQKHPITTEEVHHVFEYMAPKFRQYKAPPYQDRPLNMQELETICCKYKSYINGHYPPGLDTKDIMEGLEGWGDLAEELSTYLEPLYNLWR